MKVLFVLSIPFLFIGASNNALQLLSHERNVSTIFPPNLPSLNIQDVISFLAQNGTDLSQECAEDMHLLSDSVARLILSFLGANLTDFDVNVLLPMMDASGKINPGLLHGRTTFYGLYPQCDSINYFPEHRERAIQGGYFRMYIDAQFRNNTDKDACTPVTQSLSIASLYYSLDLCLPKSCSSAELTPSLKRQREQPTSICYFTKVNDNIADRHPMFYVILTVIGATAAVSILSGLAEFFLPQDRKEHLLRKYLSFELFLAFSLYRNVSDISQTNSQNQEAVIGPIHCMRFLSMSWIIMGHAVIIYITDGANPIDFVTVMANVSSEIVTNAFFSVDTFFFMSGLLLSFIWFKYYNRNPELSMHWRSWLMLYVHRYIRLSAPYFVALFFYTWVYSHMRTNSPRFLQPFYESNTCADYWWVNLLYINNYLYWDQGCFSVAWYLAADMQMFVFAPLLIIPLALRPKIGVLIASAAFILSTAMNIATIYVMRFPPTSLYTLGINDPDARLDLYQPYFYSSPYIRCQVYIIGILTGYLLQTKAQLRINKSLNILLWSGTFALMLTVLLGLHNYQNHVYMTIFWRAAYSSLSRIAWGLGLAWIIVACYYGYGGPINAFMSWHIWAPLGRLTYCAFLLHWIIIDYLSGFSTNELIFSNFLDLFTTRVIPAICVTFFISLFWSALFEVPIGKVEGLLLGGRKAVEKDNNEQTLWENTEEEEYASDETTVAP